MPERTPRPRPRINGAYRLLAVGCAVVALASLVLILRAGNPVQAYLVNSDAFYLAVLFDDLLVHGGSLADWYLTPAPYFFPDFLLYLLAWLGGKDVFQQVTLFALLQIVLTGAALYVLARQALASSRLLAALGLTLLFAWLGLHAGGPYVYLFSSAHHYGAFVLALLLVTLWFRRDDDRSSANGGNLHLLGGAAVGILVFFATLSDALFLVQAVLPLTLTAVLGRRGAARATGPRQALVLLLAPALAAMVSYRFVVAHPTRYKTRLGLEQIGMHVDEMTQVAAALFGPHPLLAVVLLPVLLAGAACCITMLRGQHVAGLPRQHVLLLSFATLSCAASVTLMLLSINVQAVPRYLIAALSWPLVAALFALVHLLGQRFRHAGLGLLLLLTTLLAWQAWQARSLRDSDRYFYPEQIACIDRTLARANAQRGIAQYWDAKLLQALSRRDLTLAQYFGTLEPMQWITSQRFFSERYDFAIVAEDASPEFRLPREQLIALNGEPLQSVSCGNRTVLLFGSAGLRTGPAISNVR